MSYSNAETPKPESPKDKRNDVSPLPTITRHITTTSPSGLAIFHSSTPCDFTPFNPSLSLTNIYTTSQPTPSLANETDISTHDALIASGQLGIVNPN
ncbi:MAG: hypothetical protein Q9222_006567, partial [Ikaeria aurantiellina]